MVLAFGDHRLDIERRELRRGTQLIDVEPKVFDLLAFLVQHRDRVVSKHDLLQGVWGGRIVSESALTTRINAVRRALGDDGTAQRLVRTFTRKGIRFVGEVTEMSDPATPAASDPPNRSPTAADKPSIAILPFANLSGDPEQVYFVDGMVDEIITALSRIRWLFVIARNSSFTYKGQTVDVKQVGRELGVRYVLEGSVRKAGDRVRITAQLIDALSGAHLWGDRFDGSLEDIFEFQDKVAIRAAETARSTNRSTNDLTAYDLYLRAYSIVLSEAPLIPDALRLLEQAIERDPHYGLALAWAAVCCQRLCMDGRSEDPEADRHKGADFARRALQAAGDDPVVLANAALALTWFGEDISAMMALADRALTLNPSFARGWYISGLVRLFAGQPDTAIEHVEASLHLSPRARIGWTFGVIGAAHFFSRRFDQAVPMLALAIQRNQSFPSSYRYLAACYAHMGRIDKAREAIRRLRGITSLIIPGPSTTYMRKPEHRELFLSGLRMAVGEET